VRFSRSIFAPQFEVPGLTLLRAVSDGVTIGMNGVVRARQCGLLSPVRLRCDGLQVRWGSYALLWTAWEWFVAQNDGLSWFKRGWGRPRGLPTLRTRVLTRKRVLLQLMVSVTPGDPRGRSSTGRRLCKPFSAVRRKVPRVGSATRQRLIPLRPGDAMSCNQDLIQPPILAVSLRMARSHTRRHFSP
jgi:hypothetical protein